MNSYFSYGKHVSQIDYTDTGSDNCFEASLCRYLLEAYPLLGTGGEWDLVKQVLDPKAAPGPMDLIARVRFVATGVPNAPGINPPTNLDQAETALKAYGITYTYSTSFVDAYNAAWSLCLIDGTVPQPAQEPAGWFGSLAGQENHFILWLYNGQQNDPLANIYGAVDCTYTTDSLRTSFYGAFILPDITRKPNTKTVTTAGSLKQKPDHISNPAISPKLQPVSLTVGQQVITTGVSTTTNGEVWLEVKLIASPVHGFYLAKNLSA